MVIYYFVLCKKKTLSVVLVLFPANNPHVLFPQKKNTSAVFSVLANVHIKNVVLEYKLIWSLSGEDKVQIRSQSSSQALICKAFCRNRMHTYNTGSTFFSIKSTLSKILGLNVPVIPTEIFFSLLM